MTLGLLKKVWFLSIFLLLLLINSTATNASNGGMTWSTEIERGRRLLWEVTEVESPPGAKLTWSYGPAQLGRDRALRFPGIPVEKGQRLRIEITKDPGPDSFPVGKVRIEGLWESPGEVSLRNTSWIMPVSMAGAYDVLREDRTGGANAWISDRVSTRGGILTGVSYNPTTGINTWYKMYFGTGPAVIEFIGDYPSAEAEVLVAYSIIAVGVITIGLYSFAWRRRLENKYWRIANFVAYFPALAISLFFGLSPLEAAENFMNPLLSILSSIASVLILNWLVMMKSERATTSVTDFKRFRTYLEESDPLILAGESVLSFFLFLLIFDTLKANQSVLGFLEVSSRSLIALIQFFGLISFIALAILGLMICYRNMERIRSIFRMILE
ncbi:MAG: hypothetical protein ACFFGZ_02870 [Candidatus Thorarchaeota archaeon]